MKEKEERRVKWGERESKEGARRRRGEGQMGG